ncbi:hypothetical protein C8R43DRAFT_1153864 [Mycena crocata]|nr:hypothetical protein C8R43DRAFT_1153864 [Mycena crocata]
MAVQLQVQGCVTKPPMTVHVSNTNLPSACTSPTRLRTSVIGLRRNVKCFNQGPSNQHRIVEHLHQDSASPFKFSSFNVNIFEHSLDFGRSGISAQCGNIEYTTYRRRPGMLGRRRPMYRYTPSSLLLSSSRFAEPPRTHHVSTSRKRAEFLGAALKRQKRRWRPTSRSTFNTPLPDALAFNCRGAAAQFLRFRSKHAQRTCDDSVSLVPRSPANSRHAAATIPELHAAIPARARSHSEFRPSRREIKSADLTRAVNQHDQDALDFLTGSTVLLRVHALPALCAIRASHAPTLPPCKPTCALLCRQD